MRFRILYAYLLLQVTVKSEEKWKWSSSSPSISSTEATVAITSQPERNYRYTGLATAKLVEADSYNTPTTEHVEKYAVATIQEVRDDSSYSSAEIRTSVNDTYEVVYDDAYVQKSLQEAKDNEARSHLKEKLCRLGLAKECISVDAKSYDFGIHPSSISYVQPVAIVAVGEPIPAVPLGFGQQRALKHSKSSSSKSKGHPASRFGGPSLLPIGPYGGNGLGGYGSFGSLGGITSQPIPARLPPAPVQHVHQHQVVGSPQIISPPYSAPPPAAPAVYQSLPSYNPPPTVYQPSPPPYQPPPQVYQPSPPAYNPPLRQEYNNPAPAVYNPPPRQEYSNPAPAVYNPPPRQEYTNPTPVYSPPPSRPYNQISSQSYNNGGSSYAQREQCYCVPVDQCASYDIVGRDARNYEIDPRSKLNSTIVLDYDIVVKQPEERQYVSGSSSDAIRPRRQPSQRRQDVSSPGPEGPSPVTSDAAVGKSEELLRDVTKSIGSIRQQKSIYGGPYGEEGNVENRQRIKRADASSNEVSPRTYDYGKGFKKAFGKGYAVPFPVATPVAVPQPYGVPYAVPQPVPVAQPYAVPQPVPVRVPVVQHVPVQVPVAVPVRVEVPVHVPVRVEVPVRVDVPVPVAAPYPVPVAYEQPIQVHHHYHRQHHIPPPPYVPPPAPYYPPKASVYQPQLHSGQETYSSPSYGTPTQGYSGPVPNYATASASYGQSPYYGSEVKEASATGPIPQTHYAAAQGSYGTAQETTGYDSITVQSAAVGNPDNSLRVSRTNERPRTRNSGVRFIDSRSDQIESSSSPGSPKTSSVKFENSKRKRSPQRRDFLENEGKQTSQINGNTDGRQLGGYQSCSYPQVCCRSPPKTNRYSNGAPPGTCGKRNPQGVNGRIKSLPHADGEAEFGEYPWQVAILKKDQYDNVYVCGGALVGPSHILTVAHCIKGNAPRDLRIRLGEWDVNRETEFYPHIEKDVISVIIHPEYYPGNLYNDIAVIKFEGAIDFGYNPHIAPICIPQRYQDFTGSRCWVSGWGKDAFETGGKYQNILKEVDLTVVANSECENKLRRTRLGYEFKLDHGFLCAGGEEGKDACKGDGGGPLVCESQGSWFLAGLVSWGVGCGQYDIPGVYSKVSEYSDWVKKMVVF
ncbi:uncharacterized protein LOC130703733 [Daphnia carinata]|uniref:uncharacterized protein LOC130703733 n=1 Tax=Daphnia carinata TaxID=120202 RepID=UPI00257FB1BC|nr:uncharacterized protein LOC130703733 [Daphnia carinata]